MRRTQRLGYVLGAFLRRPESCRDHPLSNRVVQRSGRDLRTEWMVNRAGLASTSHPRVSGALCTCNGRRAVLSQTPSALTGTKSGQCSCCWFWILITTPFTLLSVLHS